jgi:hypothetical protein
MFGVEASMEESFCAFVVEKISLFRRLSIPDSASIDPLSWW